MGKKVVIIGGGAGGISLARRVRRLDESADIVIFERGPYLSASNCCLPNFLSREIPTYEDLILMTPEKLKNQYNINANVMNEVYRIDSKTKKVFIKDINTGRKSEETYDDLILASGTNSRIPKNIQGINKDHVFSVKNIPDIINLDNYINKNNVKNIVVVGGGFMGLKLMESLKLKGHNLSLVETENQIMQELDYDMSQILNKEILDKEVNLILNDSIKEIHDDKVILESKKEISAQCVIISTGVYPETSLAKKSKIKLGKTGGIKVSKNYETSIPNIYAVGDVIENEDFITKEETFLTLPGLAQIEGRACGDYICGISSKDKKSGTLSSSIIKLFDINAASTGLNEKQCIECGLDYMFSFIIPKDKVPMMPNSNTLFFKLLFHKKSGKILGAQAVGKGNIDKRIDVISSIIRMEGSLVDLKEMELAYAPDFNTPKDPVNVVALVGLNLLNRRYKQIPVTKIRGLVENGGFFIDVREKEEYVLGHIENSINIPLSEFRQRINKIPKDRPVYVYCRSGQRSYNAVLALQGKGYTNVYNVQGSMLGISYYEYYNDKISGRKPILTNYNFN